MTLYLKAEVNCSKTEGKGIRKPSKFRDVINEQPLTLSTNKLEIVTWHVSLGDLLEMFSFFSEINSWGQNLVE